MNKKLLETVISSLDDELIIEVGEDEEEIDFDLDLDIKDAIVEPIDGVLIKATDDEIRLLFYYHKPGGVDVDEEIIRCKGVAEFRTSKNTFREIVKNVNKKYKSISLNQKKIDDFHLCDRSPMFA